MAETPGGGPTDRVALALLVALMLAVAIVEAFVSVALDPITRHDMNLFLLKVVIFVSTIAAIAVGSLIAAVAFVGVVAILAWGCRWALGRDVDGARKGQGGERDGCDGYPTFL